ncbi:hypothetical protein EC957_004487 [Mortierella hygrophila]|uniref:Uncharacterized protein n=1 Tax=Mortierella hygrophila TaxID=979708 RepID=A0A9P6FF69_9FUNG|nr:hypothetical protein EC957_004487 [Mortierella hygrophila]
MGARELAWFADHLPALEEVEFFRNGVNRHSFRWLKKERPDLKMKGLPWNTDHVQEITMGHFFCDTYLGGAFAFAESKVSPEENRAFDPQSSKFRPLTRLTSF